MKAWHSGLTNSGMVKVCDADGNIICLWGRSEETIKRANLIAAAPEMYEALAEAVKHYGKPGGPWSVPSEPGSWIAKAKDALKKARGKVR